MLNVNSLSAGRSSSYMAVHYPADYDVFSLVCLDDRDCAPTDRSLIQYANAKLEKGGYIEKYGEFIATAEDDQSLAAMRDLEQLLGREIQWVRGESFDNIIDQPGRRGKRARLPSWARRYCTLEMKLEPIFWWWFYNIGERCQMRIGFRSDEWNRMEGFMNKPEHPDYFRIPVACSTKGQRLQRHEDFLWRFCTFPMVRDGVNDRQVGQFWKTNGWVGGNLFEERRQIVFPKISNCVFCFHKKPETLAVMCTQHPRKLDWAVRQEGKGMGTWRTAITYRDIMTHALSTPYSLEMLNEMGAACDSGGCTD